MTRYLGIAALLGLGWFVALLVPPWTRDWLLAERRYIGWNVALLVVTSVIVARMFRSFIDGAGSFREDLVRGLLLPYAGCMIYLTLWNAVSLTRTLVFSGLANLHDALILYPWGLTYSTLACLVVVPYGYFCQVVMKRTLDAHTSRLSAAHPWMAPGRPDSS